MKHNATRRVRQVPEKDITIHDNGGPVISFTLSGVRHHCGVMEMFAVTVYNMDQVRKHADSISHRIFKETIDPDIMYFHSGQPTLLVAWSTPDYEELLTLLGFTPRDVGPEGQGIINRNSNNRIVQYVKVLRV